MRTTLPRRLHPSKTLKLGGQLSLVALLAGLGSACSSVGPFAGPTFTGSTANQKQIIAGAPGAAQPGGYAYGGASAGIQSADLAAPPGAPVPAYNAAAAPQAYTPPKAYAASGLPTPLGQTNGASAAPRPVNPPGQTLAQLGAPPSSLGEQAAKISGPKAAGGTYTVQSGDTMYNIARRNGVPVNELIAANGGSTVAKLGQRVIIPGGGSAAPAAAPAPEPKIQLASVDATSTPAAPPAPASPPAAPVAVAPSQDIIPQPAAVATPAPIAAEPAAAPQPAAAPAGFRWPVRGRVISGFGKKPDGERNDGINLAVPEGTPVKAAEDGTVIYSGNELKSYGNLILVRHEGGWVSAYAHNSELQVKRGDTVRRGQIVANSGMSGGVTTPQVHFELRKDATPVNPLQHLSEG